MSGDDQAAPSFGDPNARPPTPQRTPTSATTAAFSSPLLETPKQNSGRFDEATGWTPRFAEDYSVFNSTPGNLRGSSSAFHSEFAPLSPLIPATGKKRPFSAEGVALEIATHANHLSANPQNLPPVDPSRRLPSSPDPLTFTHSASTDPSAAPTASQQPGQRSAKKFRSSSSSEAASRDAPQAQTATPPPSSRGGRKIAPKLQTDIMQHQNFVQPDFSNAPPTQHPHLDTSFVTGGPDDVFGYPMGPATAPPITGPRPFWGMDMDTTGMGIDVDISAAGADIFQNSQTQGTSDQTVNSMGWGSANQVFQQTNLAGQQQQSHVQAAQQNPSTRRERPLAPKTVTTSSPKFSQASPGQNYSFGSFQMSMDDPFSSSPGGVDPGLLFSQHSSLSMPMEPSPQRPSSSAPIVNPGPNELSAPVPTNDIRRSKSIGAQGQRKQSARPPATVSPTKSSAVKPGLSRSFSESSKPGKRTVGGGRPLLPTLAPAPVAVHQPSLPPPVASQNNALTHPRGVRSGGRRSPVKSSHHHRLSSLMSIPENTIRTQQARQRSAKLASVKFVIGEDGRARTETVVDDEDDLEPVFPSTNQSGSQRSSWAGPPVKPDLDDEEFSSSSDDEPIIIPSRNTSFNFPEPPRSSSSSMSRPPTAVSNMSQNRRQRSVSERSSFSSTSFRRNPRNGPATSLVDQMEIDQQEAPPPPTTRPSTGGSLGDAAAELRKVMQAGTSKRPGVPAQVASSGSGQRQRLTPGQRSSSSTISATPSPTHNPSQGQVRCVCNRPEPEVDGLLHLIKCDSCDHMLHGRCVDVPTPQDVPHVYICAFCALTPNMRGGRMRYTGRNQSDGGGGGGMMGPPALTAPSASASSSPLAHKSFRSFR